MKHEPKPPRRKLRDLGPIIRRRPAVFAVYLVLRLIVIAVLVSSILRREYESAFICLLVLVLFMLPLFIQQNFGIELHPGDHHSAVHLRGGDPGGAGVLFHHLSLLGLHAPHHHGVPVRRHGLRLD